MHADQARPQAGAKSRRSQREGTVPEVKARADDFRLHLDFRHNP